MKIIDKIKEKIENEQVFFSFEYFPPKTAEGVNNLYERFQRMLLFEPLFVDVTWGAGGSTSELTAQICETSQTFCGLETMMHLTCTNMPQENIYSALEKAKSCGIQNILALRGDPPRGEEWRPIEGGFSHGVDLVKYIRKTYGNEFGIAVAGYPEGHSDAVDKELDLKYLKEKVDAGADIIITQLFYDVDLFIEWVAKCRKIGITCPILPGIMPIHTYAGFVRMTTLSKTHVPTEISEALEPIKDNDEEVKKYGIKLCIEMCRKLLDAGVPGLHFYTLNLERSVKKVLKGLSLISKEQMARQLPWNQCATSGRLKEEVRPIFWKHRPRSYISRTGSWDEFPNGRWGDSRSPAFGDLTDYHLAGKTGQNLKVKGPYCVPLHDAHDVFQVFADYVSGNIKQLPWNETPLSPESNLIKEQLVQINKLGFLTINSQPAINGVSSSDKIHGWGGKGGYIYQKAYVEFFTSPENLELIVEFCNKSSRLTYHAINLKGHALTNTKGTNAVTWGVFPGKEIIQPTVVDAESFVVWKDEAFALWKSRWANEYAEGTESRTVLDNVINSYYLVNIVDNNFVDGDLFQIFVQLTTPRDTAA
eukprot:TRINITY_DN118_c0_g3_i1.p1 TRINITY_DN118_c0_g3~~TRINITY_DN118_c0_g3_i1.p1  ORF type:complete len:590 (-),score=124.48 TRINITY_DN118_c0_g3_i1:117-1886(-)